MFQPKRYSSSFQYSHSIVMPNEPKIPESEVISMPMRPQIEQEQLFDTRYREHKKKYKPAEKLKLKLYKNMKKMKKERLDTKYRGTGNHTNHQVRQSMDTILNLF